jgi:subtilisin family serine protease
MQQDESHGFRAEFTVANDEHETTYVQLADQMLVHFAEDVPVAAMDEIITIATGYSIQSDPPQQTRPNLQAANERLLDAGYVLCAVDDVDEDEDDASQVPQFLAALSHHDEVASVSPVYAPDGDDSAPVVAVVLDRITVELDLSAEPGVVDELLGRGDLIPDREIGTALAPYYVFHVRFDAGNPAESYRILEEVLALPGVVSAEHGWLQLTDFFSLVPDDPEYRERRASFWGLDEIDVNRAWAIKVSAGGAPVKIAVIDDGFELHEDLHYSVETGPAFQQKLRQHGTMVAGIAAAQTNNGKGTVGVGFDCLVHPIPLEANDPELLAAKILEAVAAGVVAINMSLGFRGLSKQKRDVIRRAIEVAVAHNVVPVAAVGNDTWDVADYPASDSMVIGVGAINRHLLRRANSNYNVGLNLVAPGDGCRTTDVNNGYGLFGATSCAAPHVTGLVALIRSIRPDLDVWAVRTIIETSCTKIQQVSPEAPEAAYSYKEERTNGRWDYLVGFGLINCARAMESAQYWPIDLPAEGEIVRRHLPAPTTAFDDPSLDQYCGYAGESTLPEHLRLYCSLDLTEWVDIPRDDIQATRELEPGGPLPLVQVAVSPCACVRGRRPLGGVTR